MSENITISYNLHKFSNSNDSDFIQGLNIYSRNIESSIRTSTNEIIYWVDQYNKTFNDSFFTFGLYQNNTLIGFTQVAHFKSELILAIDYMVIDELYRGNNTFYVFVNLIREYFIDFEINFVIAEIVYNNIGLEPSEKARYLIRLLKMAHFKVIKAPYFQPMLGTSNIESEMKAVLMLYSSGEFDQIKKETYELIVNTIYYKHYLRWYDEFLSDKNKADYINGLNKLYELIFLEIKDKKYIELNGHHYLPSEPVLKVKKNVNKVAVTILVIGVFTLLFTGLIALHLFLKNKFKIEINVQIFILIGSVLGCILFLSYVLKRQENIFSKLLDKVLDKIIK